MDKVKSNYENDEDNLVIKTGNSAIQALTDNKDYTFTTQLTDIVSAVTDLSTKLAKVPTGGHNAVTIKNTSRGVLNNKLNVLATSVNLQYKGNLAKLQESGLPMHKTSMHSFQEVPEGFKVGRTNIAGNMDVSVFKPINNTHGTIFAFWKPSLGPTPANINDWFFRHSNGLSLTITGLTANVPHPFAAAFKGLDNEPLVWSAITTISPGD